MSNKPQFGFKAPTAPVQPANQTNGLPLDHCPQSEYMGRAALIAAALIQEQVIAFDPKNDTHMTDFAVALEIISGYLEYFDQWTAHLQQKPGEHIPAPFVKIGA